jgi:hypothetical protein
MIIPVLLDASILNSRFTITQNSFVSNPEVDIQNEILARCHRDSRCGMPYYHLCLGNSQLHRCSKLNDSHL